ncbi:MAG: FapA family protein, partial [Phycisphaerales bacterium]|nr:FapA family protein [Phycisphaerales bacterium]
MGADTPQPAPRVEIAPDALTAELVVHAGTPPLTRDAIVALASDAHLALTPDTNDLISEAAAALAALGGGTARLVIARGQAPEPAVPGRVQFEPGYDPDEWKQALARAAAGNAGSRPSGSVDHYTKSIFNFVKVGAHVATIVYPFDGAPGRDVFGNAVNPAPVATTSFSVDDTLRKQDDGRLIAMRPGVLEWGEMGLHITDKIEVP